MADIEPQLHVEKENFVIKGIGRRNGKGRYLERTVVDKQVLKSFCPLHMEYSILICLDSICLADGFKKSKKDTDFYC
jgi:hypothetical protein